jgi:hypothetical protein
MNNNEDILRRLSKLEDHQEKISSLMQEVILSSTKLSIIVEAMKLNEPRIRALEEAAQNTNSILTIIKWLSIAIIGACITSFIGGIGETILQKLLN